MDGRHHEWQYVGMYETALDRALRVISIFYIGSIVQNHPLEAECTLADGHDIRVYTWSHPYITAVASKSVFAELYFTGQIIMLATDVTPSAGARPTAISTTVCPASQLRSA